MADVTIGATLQAAIDQATTPEARTEALFQAARYRVEHTPALAPYTDVLLYDWTEGDEHWEWVRTAPIAEIVDWAETVEANVRQAAAGDADAIARLEHRTAGA